MKAKLLIVLIAIALTSASCNSNTQADTKENTSSKTDQKAAAAGDLEGEWTLVKIIADNNGDHKIDPDEDAKAITTMQDYIKLNADGTCEYTIAKLDGRYETITTADGKKKLVMYDKSGAETNKGRYIISVTDKELVINRILSGSDFEVFKRQ